MKWSKLQFFCTYFLVNFFCKNSWNKKNCENNVLFTTHPNSCQLPLNKLPYLRSKSKHMAQWMSISERYEVSSIIFMNWPKFSKVSSQSPELVFSSIVNLFSKFQFSWWFPEIFKHNVFWRNFWASKKSIQFPRINLT